MNVLTKGPIRGKERKKVHSVAIYITLFKFISTVFVKDCVPMFSNIYHCAANPIKVFHRNVACRHKFAGSVLNRDTYRVFVINTRLLLYFTL